MIFRSYGGIPFRAADLAGRLLGLFVAGKAWAKAQNYFEGTAQSRVCSEKMMSEGATSR